MEKREKTVQSFSPRAHNYNCSDVDGGDWLNREGAEATNDDGDERLKKLHDGGFRALAAICKEDKRSRGQGLVRAALGGRPGMKWITHTQSHKEKQWRTGRTARVQACESDT